MSYPDNNPKTAHGAKKPTLHVIPPSAILAMGEVMKTGAAKYGAFNWRQNEITTSVYYNAAMRHLMQWWDGEDVDPESGQSHLAHVACCMALLIDSKRIGLLQDDRPGQDCNGNTGPAGRIIRGEPEPDPVPF